MQHNAKILLLPSQVDGITRLSDLAQSLGPVTTASLKRHFKHTGTYRLASDYFVSQFACNDKRVVVWWTGTPRGDARELVKVTVFPYNPRLPDDAPQFLAYYGYSLNGKEQPKTKGRIPKKRVLYKSGLKYFASGRFFDPSEYTNSGELWQAREMMRLREGVYKPIGKSVWKMVEKLLSRHDWGMMRLQYPHVADIDDTRIACTPTPQHGYEDKQIVMKPGRFFGQFTDNAEYIKQLAGAFGAARVLENSNYTLHFADNATGGDEGLSIAELYQHANDCGVTSCMGYKADYFDNAEGFHPCEAYHPDDWAVAYLREKKDKTRLCARAIVSKKTLNFRSIYAHSSDAVQALTGMLQAIGYTNTSSTFLHGHRLLAIKVDYGFVGPYIDGECYPVYYDSTEKVLYIGEREDKNGNKRVEVGNTQASHSLDGCIGGFTMECSMCGEINSRSLTNPEENEEHQDLWGNRLCESCLENHYVFSELSGGHIPIAQAVFLEYREEYAMRSHCRRLRNESESGDEYAWPGDCVELALPSGDIEFILEDDYESGAVDTVELPNSDIAATENTIKLQNANGATANIFRIATHCDANGIHHINGAVTTTESGEKIDVFICPPEDFAKLYYSGAKDDDNVFRCQAFSGTPHDADLSASGLIRFMDRRNEQQQPVEHLTIKFRLTCWQLNSSYQHLASVSRCADGYSYFERVIPRECFFTSNENEEN